MLTAAIVAGVLYVGGIAWLAWEAYRAPVGEEIPGIGFVELKR